MMTGLEMHAQREADPFYSCLQGVSDRHLSNPIIHDY
jgi:hypothetical protein